MIEITDEYARGYADALHAEVQRLSVEDGDIVVVRVAPDFPEGSMYHVSRMLQEMVRSAGVKVLLAKMDIDISLVMARARELQDGSA